MRLSFAFSFLFLVSLLEMTEERRVKDAEGEQTVVSPLDRAVLNYCYHHYYDSVLLTPAVQYDLKA